MPESTRPQKQIRFFFVTPVWGVNHLGLFLEIGLPSLLASGNLPSLSHPSACRFLIYTRECDEASLIGADVFERLNAVMPVEVHRIPEPLSQAHRVMSDCHMAALQLADAEDAATVFIPPDCVWAHGSMASMERLAKAGKSLVHISGIRLDRDAMVPLLREHLSKDRCTLDIGSRPLVSLGLAHLHPIAMMHFWNEHAGGLMPANLYWTVPGEGLSLRCFHLHPLMVKPQEKFARFRSTIDDDLGPFACPDESGDYVVADSDEIHTFELSGPERVVACDFIKGDVDSAAAWVEVGTNGRHHHLVTHPIRIHAGPMTETTWRIAEREGDAVVAQLLKLHRSSSLRLALRHPFVLHYRDLAMSLRCGRYAGQISGLSRFSLKALVPLANAHRTFRVLVRPRTRRYEPQLVSTIYQQLGTLKKRVAQYDGAIAAYTKAIKLNPSSPLLYLLRGRVFLLKRDVAHAAEDFKAGLKIDPQFTPLLTLLEKISGDEDIVCDESSHAFESQPSLFSSDGTMRYCNPRWTVYRSLLPLLHRIVAPGYRRVLLVGDYGYLRWRLKQQFPDVKIWAIPPGRWQSLTRALDANWDIIIWNDIECGPKAVSDDQLLTLRDRGSHVVCIVASDRRRMDLACLAEEVRVLPDRSARFCCTVAGTLFRTQARLFDLSWREHGTIGRLINRAAERINGAGVLLGLPLSGVGSLIRLVAGELPSE